MPYSTPYITVTCQNDEYCRKGYFYLRITPLHYATTTLHTTTIDYALPVGSVHNGNVIHSEGFRFRKDQPAVFEFLDELEEVRHGMPWHCMV
mmetsp:Transcript_8604/g.12855  ORF Transcript_8604/g.12855 Transcript_8604/m.12855 type:complete len:92 (-) Transcript_8604:87-362(-)